MNNTKVVIAVLVVLGVIFFAGVGIGLGRGQDETASPTPEPVVDQIMSLFRRPLTIEEIDSASPAACRQGKAFVVPANGACTVHIAPLTSPVPAVREMSFRLTGGTVATIQLQVNDALTDTKTVAGGDTSKKQDVFKEGGPVTLLCQGVAACRLQLQE